MEAQEDKRILCPNCGSPESIAFDTRAVEDRRMNFAYVRRRKKCRECEAVFSTYEVPGDEYKRMRADAVAMKNIAEYIHKMEKI